MPAQPTTTNDADAVQSSGVERDAAVETTVPGDTDANRCPYCARPFRSQERVDLHVGLQHYDACTGDEAAAFEDAYTAETAEIKLFRLKTTAIIVLLYFGLLIVYALVT